MNELSSLLSNRKYSSYHFYTSHYFLITSSILKKDPKKIMQICSQSYSQVDYWDLQKKKKSVGNNKRPGVEMESDEQYQLIYASGSIGGEEERSAEKPQVNLSF